MIKGFNHDDYNHHMRERKLIELGYHFTKGKWFDSKGRLAGTTLAQVCDKFNIEYDILPPVDYHTVSSEEAISLIEIGEQIRTIAGVTIFVQNSESGVNGL